MTTPSEPPDRRELDEPNPAGNPALAAATEAILSRRLASSSGCGDPQARRAALLLDVLPDAAAAVEAAAPRMRAILLPAENIALTVARAQLERGENPPPNTTAMLVAALDRLAFGEDWRPAEAGARPVLPATLPDLRLAGVRRAGR